MTQYHVNAKGEPGRCKAFLGQCPYGNSEEHFDTPAAARGAYEKTHKGSLSAPLNRAPKSLEYDLESTEKRAQWIEGEKKFVITELFRLERKIEDETADLLAQEEHVKRGIRGKELASYKNSMTILQNSLSLKQQKQAGLMGKLNELDFELKTQIDISEMLRRTQDNRAAKDILNNNSDSFNAQRVASMARFATAHNSGDTIAEIREDGDAVLLRMSSWPRAQEATKHFQTKGWVTEFTGDSNGGELIRVHDPSASSQIFKNSDELLWVSESNAFVIDASEFGRFPSQGFTFISKKNGEAVRMIPDRQVMGGENEVLEWTFKPENSAHRWSISIHND